MTAKVGSKTCPRCGDILVDDKLFCPNCGLAVAPLPERVAIEAFVEAMVRQAMNTRLADQGSIVREVADSAEDVVWARIRRYTWAVGVVLFLLGLFGFSSIKEAKTTIANEARSRLDPVISDTEKRVKTAQEEIGDAGQKIATVQSQLDGTSRLADEQSKRITSQGGEINHKLEDLQKASNRANSLSSGYEKQATQFESELGQMRQHAEDQSRRLEDTQKGFDAKIAQVTKQIDNVSIQQAYPDLGKKLFVIFNGQVWKGTKDKRPSDKWVNINIDPRAVGESRVSSEQLKNLADALKRAGYSTYFGTFGTGGPVYTGYGSFANSASGVIFFDSKRLNEASELIKIANDALRLSDMTAQFIDPKAVNEPMERFVIQNSGIDFQIFIAGSGR